jgi:hypothetical protein
VARRDPLTPPAPHPSPTRPFTPHASHCPPTAFSPPPCIHSPLPACQPPPTTHPSPTRHLPAASNSIRHQGGGSPTSLGAYPPTSCERTRRPIRLGEIILVWFGIVISLPLVRNIFRPPRRGWPSAPPRSVILRRLCPRLPRRACSVGTSPSAGAPRARSHLQPPDPTAFHSSSCGKQHRFWRHRQLPTGPLETRAGFHTTSSVQPQGRKGGLAIVHYWTTCSPARCCGRMWSNKVLD